MKKRSVRKSLVTLAAIAFTLIPGSANASEVTTTHCPHELTVEEIVCFVCSVTMPILEEVTGEDWQCTYRDPVDPTG